MSRSAGFGRWFHIHSTPDQQQYTQMTPHPDQPAPPQIKEDLKPKCVQIGRGIIQPALERLITSGNPKIGAQRLARNAAAHGIDLDLIWGVLGDPKRKQPVVRQVCMVVAGAGGTGMCFVSNPKADIGLGDGITQLAEISASLKGALDGLKATGNSRVRIAQMLFEPKQEWTHEICLAAGMICVGTLDYLRIGYEEIETWPDVDSDWGSGIEVQSFAELGQDRAMLAAALEGSYEGTLDCPELCGMRPMEDVIASHESTGDFDPSRWWILLKDNHPVGCCLLSHCPANESVELVYLGLSPKVQGHGLGTQLLTHALKNLRIKDTVHEVTCAVDRRNVPASKVYLRLGFKRFDARVGYVRPM
tara:strand:- start:875 stop:1957 length:1083 start_codon:yes stop_codon:yes gene_type:complete